MIRIAVLSRLLARALKLFSLTFLTVLVEPASAFLGTPPVVATNGSGTGHSPSREVRTALAFRSEPILRMRNADIPRDTKLPENALGLLEEARRILYAHRISARRRHRPPQHQRADVWALQRARRRAALLDREIALVTECMAALQPPATAVAPHLRRRIALLLEVDFRDANHAVPFLELGAAVAPGPAGVLRPAESARTAAASSRARRLSTYAFA